MNNKCDIMKNFRTIFMTLSLIGLLSLPTAGAAQSYFSLVLPQDFGPSSARFVSQGATGVANSAGYVNLWTNPAMLGYGAQNNAVMVSSTLRRFKEDRSFTAIDMFEDKVTDNVYASNRNWYPDASGGLVLSRENIHLSTSYAPVWDMRYDYKEEVRSSLPSGVYNRDPVAGYHVINREGQIYAASLGASAKIGEKWAVGVAYHTLLGQGLHDEYSVSVLREDPALSAQSDTAFTSDIEFDNTPGLFTIGLAYDINWRFRVGANFRSGTEITQQGLVSVPGMLNRVALPTYLQSNAPQTVTTKLPGRLSLGIRGKMKNPIATTAQFEAHYTDWTQYEVTYADMPDSVNTLPENFRETWEFHVGVEHIILDKVPFRFGFIYSESPLGREFEQTAFTAGGSYKWGNVTLDIGAIFNAVNYNYVDIFPATASASSRLENVNESNARVTFTLSYTL